MKGRTVALAAVALAAALLGAGWAAATVRERSAKEQDERERLARTADAIRAAVDESLEDLRRREDGRPFYLYNHYYSPPDVLAINDPVAVSPLTREPDDRRVLGHFQIDPDGTLRTPYTRDDEAAPPPRAARVLEHVSGSGMRPLWADVRGVMNPALVPTLPEQPPQAAPPERPRPRPRYRSLEPEGPLTVSLNRWGNDVAQDIEAASGGDPEANFRLQQQGRVAPITRRNTVSAPDVQQAPPQRPRPRPQARPRPRPPPEPEQAAVERPPPVPVVRQAEASIDYTEMGWLDTGQTIAMHRIVSHEGAAVVQGVVLDRRFIVEEWLPMIAARHVDPTSVPAVVTEADAADCAVRRDASGVLQDVALCYPEEALSAVAEAADLELTVQLGALVLLLLLVLVAAAVVLRAARRADELSRQKSAFVSAVSHEFRTPLTTIRMHSEMLKEGMVPSEKRGRFHDDLVRESVRLSRLVENVLELSRLEEGRRPFRPQSGDLVGHIRQIVDAQQPLLEARGVELVGPKRSAPLELPFDWQAVEQIVVNLVDNAVKYGAGPIEVDVSETVGEAVIEVRDRGPGIPESERERVFTRFHRVERPETEHMPGTGIGLSLVRDLARAHGGRAEVRARKGGGTVATVTIPSS